MIALFLSAFALADDTRTVNIEVRVTGGGNVTVTAVAPRPTEPPWVHPARWLATQGVDDPSAVQTAIEPYRPALDACAAGSSFMAMNVQVTVTPLGRASGPGIAQGKAPECMLGILTAIPLPTNATSYTVQYLYFAY
jgi:hypothetical protein